MNKVTELIGYPLIGVNDSRTPGLRDFPYQTILKHFKLEEVNIPLRLEDQVIYAINDSLL